MLAQSSRHLCAFHHTRVICGVNILPLLLKDALKVSCSGCWCYSDCWCCWHSWCVTETLCRRALEAGGCGCDTEPPEESQASRRNPTVPHREPRGSVWKSRRRESGRSYPETCRWPAPWWTADTPAPSRGNQTYRRISCRGLWSWCFCRSSSAAPDLAYRSSCWVCFCVPPSAGQPRPGRWAWTRRWYPPRQCTTCWCCLRGAPAGTARAESAHCLSENRAFI